MKKQFGKIFVILFALIVAFYAINEPTITVNAEEETLSGEYVDGEAIVVLRDDVSVDFMKKNKAEQSYGEDIKITDSFSFGKK